MRVTGELRLRSLVSRPRAVGDAKESLFLEEGADRVGGFLYPFRLR